MATQNNDPQPNTSVPHDEENAPEATGRTSDPTTTVPQDQADPTTGTTVPQDNT